MMSLIVKVFSTFFIAAYSDESDLKLLNSKIIGGRDARPQHNGHVVIIARGDRYIATGALISPKHAITNGHVVRSYPGFSFYDVSVIVGNPITENATRYYIQNIVVGQTYNHNRFTNDNYAIIYLTAPVNRADHVRVIPLSPYYIHPGTDGYVAGWGSTRIVQHPQYALPADNLKELHVRIIPNNLCSIRINRNVSPSQMCARALSGLSNSPYIGDNGDPLINNNGELIGIVNTISRALSSEATYIRISAYYQYIMSIISPPSSPDVISLPPFDELCESDK